MIKEGVPKLRIFRFIGTGSPLSLWKKPEFLKNARKLSAGLCLFGPPLKNIFVKEIDSNVNWNLRKSRMF